MADMPSTLVKFLTHLMRDSTSSWREKSSNKPARPAAMLVATDVPVSRFSISGGTSTSSPKMAKFLDFVFCGAGLMDVEALAHPSVQ